MPNLPPWLVDAIPTAGEISPQTLAVRLVVAMLLGLVIAAVYFGSQRRMAGEAAVLTTTIVLLTVLALLVLRGGQQDVALVTHAGAGA